MKLAQQAFLSPKTMALFCMSLVFQPISHSETITPSSTAKINVMCECVVDSSGCISKIFDKAANSPRKKWRQEAYGRAGVTIDLNEVCYNKRDVEKLGDGICCVDGSNKAKSISNLFLGVQVK